MNTGNLATVFAAVITTVTMATFGHAHTAPGISSAHESIAPHATNVYRLSLEPGVVTTIDVRGSGSSDLDCYVGEGDRIAAKDDSASDLCTLTFTPSDTGKIVVRVVNRGDRPNDFIVATK